MWGQLLVVGVERLPPPGPDVCGSEGDGEEDSGQQDGSRGVQTREEILPGDHVDRRGDREGNRGDEGAVQPAPRGSAVARRHPTEVEGEGIREDHQRDRDRRGPGELEPEEPREYRGEYPEDQQKPDRERDQHPEAYGCNASHEAILASLLQNPRGRLHGGTPYSASA